MIFLTDNEVDLMCRGLKQNAARVRYLQMLGLTVKRKPDGSPLVIRSQVEAVAKPDQTLQQPAWST